MRNLYNVIVLAIILGASMLVSVAVQASLGNGANLSAPTKSTAADYERFASSGSCGGCSGCGGASDGNS